MIVRSGDVRRTAILAVPRMDHLMGHKARPAFPEFIVDQHALGRAIVTGLVVLEPEVRDLIAERQQKIVFPEVTRAKERFLFHHELREAPEIVRLHFEGRDGIGHYVEAVWHARAGRQIECAQVSAGS